MNVRKVVQIFTMSGAGFYAVCKIVPIFVEFSETKYRIYEFL